MKRILCLLLVCGLAACQASPTPVSPSPEPPAATPAAAVPSAVEVVLPAPRQSGALSVEEALARRRSVRTYTGDPLSMAELSQLLWACQGTTHQAGLRTAPSAGALYPLETYVARADGVYRYLSQGHRLQVIGRADVRSALSDAAVGQEPVAQAPAVFVIAAVYQRTAQKYGERATLYIYLEAGHAAQNLLLQAVSLGLGGVPIGAMYEDRVQKALSLPDDHQPVYIIAIGHPAP
jgi:SagB-type dehydrogenase family enzyme